MEYSRKQIDEAWERSQQVEGYDPKVCRKDPCGAWIKYDQYGEQSEYGWNIDHIMPKTLFELSRYEFSENRRAMHWENNNKKSDDFPIYTGIITSDGNHNIQKESAFNISESTITNLIKSLSGLGIYIQKHKEEWVNIYGKELVDKWIYL